MASTFTTQDVAAYEHETWSRCAPGYDDGFAALTGRAVATVLDRAGVTSGSRVLDVGTGTGVAAAVAADRGAIVTGVDFSDAMLAVARREVPRAVFRSASADELPFEDGAFDAVVANGVLHHLARPGRALSEAFRVLRPGGRIACTVWGPMEQLEAFGLFFAAVSDHAGSAELPHGPLFGVTDHDVLAGLFTDAGFDDATIEDVPTAWPMPSIEDLIDALGTWAQLDAFPPDVAEHIRVTVRDRAQGAYGPGPLEIPNPMLCIAGTRPAA